MDESNDELQRLARAQMYKIVVPIFVIISCFGVLANATVVLALRATKVRNATVTLILSLTISDIWTSSIVAFSLLYNSYLPTVQGTQVNLCFSLTLEMLRTGGLITGILHLLLISIHHYIGIVRPYTSKMHLKTITQCLCSLAWLTPSSMLFALALAFPGEGFWNCEHVHFYYTRAFRWTVSGMLTSIFLIITSAYYRLLRILREQRKKWRCQQLYSVAASTTAMIKATYSPTLISQTEQQNGGRRLSRAKISLVRIVLPTMRNGTLSRGSVPIICDNHNELTTSLGDTDTTVEHDAHSLDQHDEFRAVSNTTTYAKTATVRDSAVTMVLRNESQENEAQHVLLERKTSPADATPRNGAIRWQSDWKPPSEWNLEGIGAEPNALSKKNDHSTVKSNGSMSARDVQHISAAAEKRAARENRTLWTTILICSSFFLGWAPATILFTLTCDTCALHNGDQSVLFTFSCIQLCFILGKSLVNPLIYSLRIPEVDSELRFVMQRLCRRIRHLLRWHKHEKTHKMSTQARTRCRRRVLDSPTESLIVGSVGGGSAAANIVNSSVPKSARNINRRADTSLDR